MAHKEPTVEVLRVVETSWEMNLPSSGADNNIKQYCSEIGDIIILPSVPGDHKRGAE